MSQTTSRDLTHYEREVGDILECPCCYKIPREIPIVSCRSGHIICRECRKEVTNCPTCRGILDCTNTIASNIASISIHKCTYEVYGCGKMGRMIQIKSHEEICPERTVVCPFRTCSKDIQLKSYEHHALFGGGECAIDLDRARGNL